MKYELNIYGKDNVILKSYGTDHISWGTFMQATELNEEIKTANASDKFAAINKFVMSIFDGLTESELKKADGFDVINTFNQILSNAAKINGGSKN